MRKNRCFKLITMLLALMIAFSMFSLSALAEEGNPETVESKDTFSGVVLVDYVNLQEKGFVKSAKLLDAANKEVTDFSKADPNKAYTLKLSIGDGTEELPPKTDDVRMSYPVANMSVKDGSNEDVRWTYDSAYKEIVFEWVSSKKDSFSADISVSPAYPTDNNLSGSYILGTGGNDNYKVMLGSTAFMDGSRARITGTAFSEVDGKVYSWSEAAASVWELKHVSGNYYTVRSKDNGKYLKIIPSTNGLALEETTEENAQKLLVTSAGNGYYIFSYEKRNINNSSFNATKGFASYNSDDKGTNVQLKLYSPSAVMTEAIYDLSGTWVISNATRKNILTAETQSTARLKAVSYTAEGNFLILKDDVATFIFEHIVRDWYTVRTDGGYLNISDKGAFISSNPQHLMVRTDKQYQSIILTTTGLDNSYSLNNVNGKTSDGYGSYKGTFADNTRLTLCKASNVLSEGADAYLSFNVNGGTAGIAPEGFAGKPGERVVLPDLDASKDGNEFIGWADAKSVYLKVSGTNHTYHDVYKPGTSYKLKSGSNTLYAIYNNKGTKKVRFGIRKDGVIQDEPNGYDVKGYIGHFEQDLSILKEAHWVIDIDSTKTVNGYYLQNNITANLNWVPSAETIAKALMDEGNVEFDPETQYIHYYVMKCIEDTTWKIDGVIRNKEKVGVSYNANVPGGEKTSVKDLPGGEQVVIGSEVLIGTSAGSAKVLRPIREGYLFNGWNTEPDGSGTSYSEGHYVKLTENINLYAQWIDIRDGQMVIIIHSDWPDGKLGYVGAQITLTAELTGFTGRMYDLQWQYAYKGTEDWVDIPGADQDSYIFILDEINTNYDWRCVAKNVR